MTVSVGIVAHTSRIDRARRLAVAVEADYLSVDDGTLGCNANHLEVWTRLYYGLPTPAEAIAAVLRVYGPDLDLVEPVGLPLRAYGATKSDWLVVIEDDAMPCNDFRTQLDQALAVAPTSVVGLYLGRSYPAAWQNAIAHIQNDPAHWAVSTHLLHAVGTAIRTDLVPGMIDWVRKCNPQWPIDDAITDWARTNRTPIGYTRPSLLDHADGDSLIASRFDGSTRDKPRTAWAFGTREHWNRTQVGLP